MHLLKTINRLRRAATHRLTRNLGKTRLDGKNGPVAQNIKRVLICRPNHRLGNLLLITPLLQEVTETLPNVRIDLFTKGSIAPILFKNYENIDRIIQLPKKPMKNVFRYLKGWITIRRNQYDLVINVVNHSASGKLSAQMANSKYRFLGDINEHIQLSHHDSAHMAKYPVYSFRNFIEQLGYRSNMSSVPSLDLKLSPVEIKEGKKVLYDLVRNEKRTICLYTFATGAKCYPPVWWESFYERLKVRYPGYNVIEILPIENVSQISFSAPSFYSRDLRAIGSLIANTDLFIGADSGI